MRLTKIQNEVDEYYHLYLVSSDLIELRNLITTAQITVESAISRTESRGLHYNEDYRDRLLRDVNTKRGAFLINGREVCLYPVFALKGELIHKHLNRIIQPLMIGMHPEPAHRKKK
jgi:hypothetical protein